MKVLLTAAALLLVLSGCQSLRLQPAPDDNLDGPALCEAPQPLPMLDNSPSARLAWLTLQLQLSDGDAMAAWRALQNYAVVDPRDAQLVAALVTSRPATPEALRRLGQRTLERLMPSLPSQIQPIIGQAVHYNAAALSRDAQQRALTAAQQQVRQLATELAEKQRQIDALTAIESQLRNNDVTEGDDRER